MVKRNRKTGTMVVVKNPSPGANLVLLLAAAGIGYGVYRHRQQAAAALRRAREVVDDVRIPMPHFAVVIPNTQEEHEMIDDAICACLTDLRSTFEEDTDVNTIVSTLTLCAAEMLYPDFPWPPQAGDHESIPQFWTVLEFRIRSLAFDGRLNTVCPVSMQPGEEEPGQPGLGEGEGEPEPPGPAVPPPLPPAFPGGGIQF